MMLSRYNIHFTIIVHPEMYRDTVLKIVIYPDMYHDTVSSWCLPFFCVLCFCCCTRASLCCLVFRTHVSLPMSLSQDSLSKVFNVETSQLEGIPCHEWYSVLLGSTQHSLLVSTRWELGSFLCCRPGWKLGILAVCIWTSLVGE